MARLTSTGALDGSFDGDGKQLITFGETDAPRGQYVGIDSLNRIVVTGMRNNNEPTNRAVVCRLTPAGTLDTSFDGDGKEMITLSSTGSDSAFGGALDSQDRIVIAGYADGSSTKDFAVARLNVDGTLDASFGDDGKFVFDLGVQSKAHGTSIVMDSMGRALVAGYASSLTNTEFMVARYTIDGSLDRSFGGTGVVTFGFGMRDDQAYSVTVDSLNRIVVAGYTQNGSNRDFAVARLSTAGVLDTSFDSDGKQTISFGTSDDVAYGVAVDSLNRIVVVGYTVNGSNNDFALARLTTSGELDFSFDGDGKRTIDFGSSSDRAYGVDVDSQNRIVVAGVTFNGSNNDFAIARVTAAGGLDSSFDGDGKQTVDYLGANDSANGVALDSLDRVVVAGLTHVGSNDDFAVTRLTSAGALDISFDGDGRQTIDLGSICRHWQRRRSRFAESGCGGRQHRHRIEFRFRRGPAHGRRRRSTPASMATGNRPSILAVTTLHTVWPSPREIVSWSLANRMSTARSSPSPASPATRRPPRLKSMTAPRNARASRR